MATSRANHRLHSLDGLRTAAVSLVFLHHFDESRFPGGFLGVTVFFVLSGYLIASLLIREFRATKTVSISRFYRKRWLRLTPAFAVMLLVVVPLSKIVGIGSPLKQGLAAATYLMDFYVPIRHDSGGTLAHTWSLAVEEQFYLAFPIILLVALRRQRGIFWFALSVSAFFTIVTFAVSFQEPRHGFALYTLPSTHAASLGTGVFLAASLETTGVRIRQLLRSPITPLVSLSGLLLAVFVLHPFQAPMYRGGLAIASILAGALIGHLILADGSRSWTVRVLSLRPAVWLGERSYAFYLWHLPAILILGVYVHSPALRLVLSLAITLLATTLSWHLVEQPFARRRLELTLRGPRG